MLDFPCATAKVFKKMLTIVFTKEPNGSAGKIKFGDMDTLKRLYLEIEL